MKKISVIFLRAFILLIGIVALFILIRFPLMEGRATKLDMLSIYLDPLILYGYATSIAFFIALYKAFKLLGYVGQNKVFSLASLQTIRSIKHCAIALSVLIVAAGVYIRLFHDKADDPAGVLALCMVTTLIAIVAATTAAIFERVLQNGIDIKSENDLTI